MENDDMSHVEHPKPSGWILVLLTPLLCMAMVYSSIRLEFREFDLEPWWVRGLMVMQSPVLILVVLPCALIILGLMRHKFIVGWLRALVVLSPVLLMTLPGFLSALSSPMKSSIEFKERMGTAIPKDASDLQAWYSHGPGESGYMFAFRCSAASMDALVRAHPYQLHENPIMLDPDMGSHFQLPIGGAAVPKGWPKPKEWSDLQVYQSDVDGGYRYLLISRNASRVFILVGDT